jgi:hypothetical protein
MTVGVADPIARVRDAARSSAAVVRLHSVRLRPLAVAAAAAAVVGAAMGLGIMGIPMVFMCKRIPRTLTQSIYWQGWDGVMVVDRMLQAAPGNIMF